MKFFVKLFGFSILIFIVSMCIQINAHGRKKPKATRKVSQPVVKTQFISGVSAQIPIELDGNIIFLKVRVNNSPPLRFIFDTGASVSLIPAESFSSTEIENLFKQNNREISLEIKRGKDIIQKKINLRRLL